VNVLEKLENPQAFLTRKDLEELGLERRAIDAIFRGTCVRMPGYRRPLVRVRDFQRFIDEHTYRGDRVRPT
jgi:hypothetical protein